MNHHTAQAAMCNCAHWRKSNASQAESDCVEVTTELPGWVGIRDSKLNDTSPIVVFPAAGWRTMLANIGQAR
jgi:hypothetical protein